MSAATEDDPLDRSSRPRGGAVTSERSPATRLGVPGRRAPVAPLLPRCDPERAGSFHAADRSELTAAGHPSRPPHLGGSPPERALRRWLPIRPRPQPQIQPKRPRSRPARASTTMNGANLPRPVATPRVSHFRWPEVSHFRRPLTLSARCQPLRARCQHTPVASAPSAISLGHGRTTFPPISRSAGTT